MARPVRLRLGHVTAAAAAAQLKNLRSATPTYPHVHTQGALCPTAACEETIHTYIHNDAYDSSAWMR